MSQSKQKISKKEALVKAQNLCARQEKCIFDIRKKLFDWKLNLEDFDDIINDLLKDKYIDEQRYAISFTREKFKFNKWGKIKIEYSLNQKSIPHIYIKKALEEIKETDYNILLENELLKKLKTIKNTDIYTIKSKLTRYALSKGFENGKVFDIITTILNEKEILKK